MSIKLYFNYQRSISSSLRVLKPSIINWKALPNDRRRNVPQNLNASVRFQIRSINSTSTNDFERSGIFEGKKRKAGRGVPPLEPLKEDDLIESFSRGSGPGGQAVNKTNNAVSLIHKPTGIRVQSHSTRSRELNRINARKILAERVDFHLNKGNSRIEKVWEIERKKKRTKLKKQKKRLKGLSLNSTEVKTESNNEIEEDNDEDEEDELDDEEINKEENKESKNN